MRTTRQIQEAADRFITEILGDRRYIQNYYPRELTLAVLGPHARESIPISRFYQWVSPPVAVDFEPSPYDSPFYCDQKRKWAHEHGIVYVPVFLYDRLTREQFTERLNRERHALELAKRTLKEDAALATVPVAPTLDATAIDQETLKRLYLEVERNPNLRGATRARRLATLKELVHREWLRLHRAHQPETESEPSQTP